MLCEARECIRQRKWLVEAPGQLRVVSVCSKHLPRYVGIGCADQRANGNTARGVIVRDVEGLTSGN